jgi:hypothetical protein
VQFIIMAFIFINTFTDVVSLKLADVSFIADLIGSAVVFGLPLAQQTFCDVFIFAVCIANISNFFQCV